MRKLPDASGALATPMGPGAVANPTGRMPVEDAAPRDTWPEAVRREELRRFRDRNWCSCSSTSEGGGMPRTSWCRLPERGRPMYCLLVRSTNGPKTLLGIKMHRGEHPCLYPWFEYSCYFSPNDPFEVFETQIHLFEENLSEAVGWTLIGGDFISKSPEWGEVRLGRRGILVGEVVSIVLNQGTTVPRLG